MKKGDYKYSVKVGSNTTFVRIGNGLELNEYVEFAVDRLIAAGISPEEIEIAIVKA